MSPKFLIVGGFVYTGLGARSVASLGGRGARLWRHPGSGYFGWVVHYMSLSLKHFVLEGVM